jgi:hypothetical protein
MGASGHNAAQVVIADLDGTAAPKAVRSNGTTSRTAVIDRVMETKVGKKLGYTVASSPVFRKVVKFAARSESAKSTRTR